MNEPKKKGAGLPQGRNLEILQLFQATGPLSQRQVADALGIKPASVFARFRSLQEQGLIAAIGKKINPGKGRPMELWDIDRENNYTIGLCFMPPGLLMGLTDFNGKVLLRKQVDVGSFESHREFEAAINKFIAAAKRKSGQLRAIFVGLPGGLDHETGTLLFSANLPALNGWDAERALTRYGIPVHANTNHYAFYFGETSELPHETTACVIDWDLGLGQLTGRGERVYLAPGAMRDFGHICIKKGGRPCRCGESGCLEAYAGGQAIIRRLGRSDIQSLETLAERAEAGDADVLDGLFQALEKLGESLSWLVQLFGVEKIIFTGPLSSAFPLAKRGFERGLGKILSNRHVKALRAEASPDPAGRTIEGACGMARRIFMGADDLKKTRGET